jgi:lipopolysaccharide/colanic/teichoic acid biosynthesis glycosyltransferase
VVVNGNGAATHATSPLPRVEDPRLKGAQVFASRRADAREFMLRRVLALTDVVGLLAAYGLTVIGREAAERPNLAAEELLVFAVGIPLWVALAALLNLYHLPEKRLDHSIADEVAPVMLTATVWSWVILMTRTIVMEMPVEVAASLAVWVFSIALILTSRALVRPLARRRPWYVQEVAIAAGGPADVARVARRLNRHPEYGLHVRGEFDLSAPETEAELLAMVRGSEVQRVVVATPQGDLAARSDLIRRLLESGVHVDLVSGETDVFSSKAVLHYVEGLPVITLPVVRGTKAWPPIKRTFDVVAASLGLVVLSPVLAWAAIGIRLGSRGPILYRQPRVGRDGKTFELFKFRTMVVGADEMKPDIEGLNLHALTGNGEMFKIEHDPRVTRFGAKLRRWSIDELPQLWQVIRGEMSLVGPRPLPLPEAAQVSGHYLVRNRIRPGMTGP